MEYVEGRDLSTLIKKDGPVSVDKAISYVMQAARGLEYAHGAGIVHRDIKPANLLLDNKGIVKILDMGLARLDDGTAANADANQGLTQTGQVMGTVDYMAPEQAFDTHRADAKADVYSLGCTLYRILTGENAFRGDTVVQKILAHREQPIPSLTKLRPEAPAALDAIYQRMMAKQPEQRPTMAEVAKELEALSNPPAAERSGPAIVIDVVKPKVSREAKPSAKPQPKPAKSGGGSKPPVKLIAGGIGGFALLVSLGVWLIIRDKGGNEIARVPLPPGATMSVTGEPGAPATGVTMPTIKPPVAHAPGSSDTPAPSFFATAASGSPPSGDYALSFDGVKSYVEVPTLTRNDNGPVTIEAYVIPDRINDRGNYQRIVTIDGSQSFFLFQSHDHFSVAGRTRDRLLIASSFNPVSLAQRVHVAAVWDERKQPSVYVYIDGKLVSKGAAGPPPPTAALVSPVATDAKLQTTLGAYPLADGLSRAFAGVIDEVRISKTARYDQEFTPQPRLEPDADTLALYHFDEGTGDVLRDASGNGHDGKIIGATWVRVDGAPITSPVVTGASYTHDFLLLGDGYAQRWDSNGKEAWSKSFAGRSMARNSNQNMVTPEKLLEILKAGKHSDVLPRIVVLQVGYSAPEETGEYRRLVAELRQRFSQSYVVLTSVFPNESQRDQVRALNGVIRTLADDKSVFFLDLDPILLDAAGSFPKEGSAGGVLSSEGYARWAAALKPLADRLLDAPTVVPPPGDYALSFDGSTSYVEVPTLGRNDTEPCTIEAFVTPARIGQNTTLYQSIVSFHGAHGVGLSQTFSGFDAFVWRDGAAMHHHGPRDIVLDRRVHVAAVWDGKRTSLYVDGKLNPAENSNGTTRRQDVHPQTIIGAHLATANNAGGSYPFAGVIDEVRISKKVRFDKDFEPPTRLEPDADTLALYHFDEGTGDVLRDASGNGHDGKIIGATWVRADGGAIPPPATPPPGDYALSFDGVKSYVEVPLMGRADGPATVEAYVTPTRRGNQTVVDWQTPQFELKQKANGEWGTGVNDGKSRYSHSTPIETVAMNQRVHLAAVFNGSQSFLYVNGILSRESHITSSSIVLNRDHLFIGALNSTGVLTGEFAGVIDEVRISKTARYDQDFTPAARFEPDADTLALYHFDEGTGDVLRDASGNGHDGKIIGATWVRADGSAVLATSDGAIDLKSQTSNPQIAVPRTPLPDGPPGEALQIALPRRAAFVAAARDGRHACVFDPITYHVRWYDLATGRLVWERKLEDTPNITGLALTADGQTLALGGYHGNPISGVVYILRTADGTSEQTLASEERIRSVAVSTDGKLLAVGTEAGPVQLYDLPAGRPLRVLEGLSSPVYAVAFSPSGDKLAAGAAAKQGAATTLAIWNTATGVRDEAQMKSTPMSFMDLAYLPDGASLLAGTGNAAAYLYDSATGDQLGSIPNPNRLSVKHAKLLAAGRYALCAGETLRLAELPSGRILNEFGEPTAEVIVDLDVTPDGRFAVSIKTNEPILRVWRLPQECRTPSLLLPGEEVRRADEGTPSLAVAPFDAAQAKAHQEVWAKHLGTEVETTNSVGMKMVLIPPGEFMMGSTDEQVDEALKVAEEIKADSRSKGHIQKYERPQHRVVITKPYFIGATGNRSQLGV